MRSEGRSERGAQISLCIAPNGDMCLISSYCIFLRLDGVIGDNMEILRKSGCLGKKRVLWFYMQSFGVGDIAWGGDKEQSEPYGLFKPCKGSD